MSQDMRGNIAAIALCIGVATATVITAISETGHFPLDRKEVKQATSSSPSASPSKEAPKVSAPKPTPTPTPSVSLKSHMVITPSPKPTPKEFAKEQVGSKQFKCLNTLWHNESEWDEFAINSSSGAYGIPQALPGKKMASAGKDWETNPFTQVKWGVKYIDKRYGSPCNALDHFHKMGWY